MAAEDFVDEEFWWMPLLGLPTQGRVGVAVSRWTPPDEDSLFEPIHGHSTIENLGIWAGEQRWENLHRTLEVVVDEDNPKSIFGPIVIDLDADEESFDRLGRPSNDLLQLAKDLTFNVVQHLGAAGVSNSHRRVYFSGHKGFHVHYVLPSRSDLHSTRPRRSSLWYNEIKKLREALHLNDHIPVNIDPPHSYVRLSRSVNLWGPSGSERRNRVIRILEDDLHKVTIDELWEQSKVN